MRRTTPSSSNSLTTPYPCPRPFVLMTATPILNHLMPMLSIAHDLVRRNYDVTFITGSFYHDFVTSTGATFVPLSGYCNMTEEASVDKWPLESRPSDCCARFAFEKRHIFIRSIPGQFKVVRQILDDFDTRDSNRPVIVINEYGFMGILPTMLDASNCRRPAAVITVNVLPLPLSSIDLPPFGSGLLPNTTPEGRARNVAMTKHVQTEVLNEPNGEFQLILRNLGCNPCQYFFLDAPILLPDRFFQMCGPSVEYPRSDAPSRVRFAGGIPAQNLVKSWMEVPSWWNEIVEKRENRRIVAVSQSDTSDDLTNLVIPTIEGLKDSPDILILVTTGKKDSSFPENIPLPPNVRVQDFTPLNELFKHIDVFVTSGDYGDFQQALSHGIPLVIAAAMGDRPEIAARGEWAGVAVNLRTGEPSKEAVRDAVRQVLENEKYKKRALDIQREMGSYSPFQIIADSIDEFARRYVAWE